ncbi:hypothetical protein [Aquirhabdus parva]|uniref:Uncharacterized protein n=1 Tax=Aquirhabdus parva TaxID=2283318 RepID=A0A345P3Z7_9GAMM|nr:hypothetical protein [Aquirhabdus parva]AXI02006.1 hypothetical protein HYN46_03475 [Aquirhabdus parva]
MTAIRKTPEMFMPNETVLELVQLQTGVIALRSADFPAAAELDAESFVSNDESLIAERSESSSEPLVTIQFSEQIQEALGDALQSIGQQMIQAALSSLMEQQSAKWHAQVMDERPARFS